MLSPEVVLRFRADDGDEPLYVGATSDGDLARVVAQRLVVEAEAAAEVVAGGDATLAALLGAEAARLRVVLQALGVEPLQLVPR